MEIIKYSNMEAQILSFITENTQATLEQLTEKMSFGDKTVLSVLTNLVGKNIIKFENDLYTYINTTKKTNIILHGNLLLPVTIIKQKDRILVGRGKWYTFENDFDISSIIWNVDLESTDGKKTSLIELIENQAMTAPTAKIKQMPKYEQLREKIVPYNKHIDLLLKIIGEEYTRVEIVVKQKLLFDKNSTDGFLFREFKIPSQISTDELIECLQTPIEKRNFENIKIQSIFSLADIVYNGNSIPVNVELDKITYIKIRRDRQKLVLDYKKCDSMGNVEDVTVEEYPEISDGITVIENNLNFAKKLLSNANILLENA